MTVRTHANPMLTNWSRTHTFMPREIHAPASLEELLAVVQAAGRAGRTVKPAGSLHSWSACAVTDDVSVQMEPLNRVLAKATTNREKLLARPDSRRHDLVRRRTRVAAPRRLARRPFVHLESSPPEEFLRNYPEHHRFVEAKQELDPCGVFANAFSNRISGVGRAMPAPR